MRTMKVVGFVLCLVLTFACKKEEEGVSACVKLEAIWTCQTWIEDGVTVLGTSEIITSATLDFRELTGVQGDFEWIINYQIGGEEIVFGAYVVNEDCNMVTMTPKAGVPSYYDFHFEGDQLVLEGTNNAVFTELEFSKN